MDFYLRRALDVIESTTRGMDLRELRAHRSGKWCAAEILEHLALTFSSTSRLLERCLRAGEATGHRPSVRQRLATAIVVELGVFPTGRPAPDFSKPRGLPPDAVLGVIRDNLQRMDATITACERRFGAVRLADHAVLGPLTARQWRRFHWVHTRHHMKQIARLRALPLQQDGNAKGTGN